MTYLITNIKQLIFHCCIVKSIFKEFEVEDVGEDGEQVITTTTSTVVGTTNTAAVHSQQLTNLGLVDVNKMNIQG